MKMSTQKIGGVVQTVLEGARGTVCSFSRNGAVRMVAAVIDGHAFVTTEKGTVQVG